MVERGERRPKIEVRDNEGIETPLGRLRVTVDIKKLAERLERKFPLDRRRPDELRIFLGKRSIRTVVIEKHAQEWREQGESETDIRIQSMIADKLALGVEKAGLLPTAQSSFYADERKSYVHINVPLVSREASSMEDLQKGVARRWQHEESHLTSSEKEIKQAQELGIRGVKIVTGSALTGAGIGLLLGTTASPDIAPTARTVLSGVSGLVEGFLAGRLLSYFVYLKESCEQKARKAGKAATAEILEIFKVTREE